MGLGLGSGLGLRGRGCRRLRRILLLRREDGLSLLDLDDALNRR